MSEIVLNTYPSEASHWYRKDGSAAHEIIGKDGNPRATTLRDARKEGLVPSVTSIIRCAAAPGLQQWKDTQTILACLTLPQNEGESERDYILRLKADSREQAQKAAMRGTQIHGWVEKGFRGETLEEDATRYYLSAQKCLLEACGDVKWHSEKSFATARYGGKVDLHNAEYLIDFKTTEKDLETIKIWEEHEMQLAAYSVGLKGYDRKCGILYLHVITAEAKLIWMPVDKFQRGWNMFQALLAYWEAKNNFPAH